MNYLKKLFLIFSLILGSVAWGQSGEEIFKQGVKVANEGNLKEAFILYNKACNAGYADGCLTVGYFYEDGELGKPDLLKAKKFYEKACNLGNADGCSGLGRFYQKGLVVKKSIKKAKTFYAKACNLGNEAACDYK